MNVFGSKLKEYGIERDRMRSHGDREYYYFGVMLTNQTCGAKINLFLTTKSSEFTRPF